MTAKTEMAHENTTGTVIVFFNEDLHSTLEPISHSVDCVYTPRPPEPRPTSSLFRSTTTSAAAAAIHHTVLAV